MRRKRLYLSKRVRFLVLKRDLFRCQYCGVTAGNAVLEVDHILPISKGGSDDIDNLITSCYNCNHGKSDIIVMPSDNPENIQKVLLSKSTDVVDLSDVISIQDGFKSKTSLFETELTVHIIENIKRRLHLSAIIKLSGRVKGTIQYRIEQLMARGFIVSFYRYDPSGRKLKYYALTTKGVLWYNNDAGMQIARKKYNVPEPPLTKLPPFSNNEMLSVVEYVDRGYPPDAIAILSKTSLNIVNKTIDKLVKLRRVSPVYKETETGHKLKCWVLTPKGVLWYNKERDMASQIVHSTLKQDTHLKPLVSPPSDNNIVNIATITAVPSVLKIDDSENVEIAESGYIKGSTSYFENKTVISIIENLKFGYNLNAIIRLSGKPKGTIQYIIKKLISYGFIVPNYKKGYNGLKCNCLSLTEHGTVWYNNDVGMQRERLKYVFLKTKTPSIILIPKEPAIDTLPPA